MQEKSKMVKKQKKLVDTLGINTYMYPPQEPKNGLPEYSADSPPAAPVAAGGKHFASKPVLPFSSFSDSDWQSLLHSALGKGKKDTDQDVDEAAKLEALIQAVVEHGREMLPMLRLLREKSLNDKRLAGLVDILQSRLSLGINAACSLAPREMEVLELAAHGKSNPQIAEELNLQTVTVAKALSRAYRKLDAKNRTDAVHKWLLLRGMQP